MLRRVLSLLLCGAILAGENQAAFSAVSQRINAGQEVSRQTASGDRLSSLVGSTNLDLGPIDIPAAPGARSVSGTPSIPPVGIGPVSQPSPNSLRVQPADPWPAPNDSDDEPSVSEESGDDISETESDTTQQPSGQEFIGSLFKVRQAARKGAIAILRSHVGGDFGDGILHRDVRRVLNRLVKAAGRPPESVLVFIGNSQIPNAFTTITKEEVQYLESNSSLAKSFRVANTFISIGLLRAVTSESQLAFVLAHELQHNWKGHLKEEEESHVLLGHFHELEADAEALKLVSAAGYDARDAINTLYSLEAEYQRLEKQYTLLKRGKSDLTQTLQSIRDVHPDPDIRKGSMMNHLNEALEAFQPVPARPNPVWMQRRLAVVRPTHQERFENQLLSAVDHAGQGVGQKIHAIEKFIQLENSKKYSNAVALGREGWAAVERAYQRLTGQASTPEELSFLGLSMRRGASGPFPSKRLRSSLETQLRNHTLKEKTQRPRVENLQASAGILGEAVRRASLLRILGAIGDRAELDQALTVLSRQAENLGLDLKTIGEGMSDEAKLRRRNQLILNVSQKLWRAVRRVLTQELGRPALPEEIIEELQKKIPASWLSHYKDGFQAEILESAFGPEAFRSKAYRPSQLVAKLGGLDPMEFKKENPWTKTWRIKGLREWSERHYSPPSFQQQEDGKVDVRYERYYLNKITSPNPEDQLDIYQWFEPGLPPPFVRILVRERKLSGFLHAAYQSLAEELSRRLKDGANFSDRHQALAWYRDKAQALLAFTLSRIHDYETIREVLEVSDQELEKIIARGDIQSLPQKKEVLSRLSDGLFEVTSMALRRAIIENNMSGHRPPRQTVAELAALIRRMDARLRPFSGAQIVKAHAENIGRKLDSTFQYMKAYEKAVSGIIVMKSYPAARWRLKEVSKYLWLASLIFFIAAGVTLFFRGWAATHQIFSIPFIILGITGFFDGVLWGVSYLSVAWGAKSPIPGVPAEYSRDLLYQDFAHFFAFVGDPGVQPETKLMMAALLDRLDHGITGMKTDVMGRLIGQRASMILGRWMVEDAVLFADSKEAVESLGFHMIRLHRLHPALLQADMDPSGDSYNGFRAGAGSFLRNEPLRALTKMEHPFRNVNRRWALDFIRRLDEFKAWPQTLEERLDLLDFLNANGEFSEEIDRRIIAETQADPAGFHRWKRRDSKALRIINEDAEGTVMTPIGHVPIPRAESLRIVRSPGLRAQLFDLLPEARFTEKERRGPWDLAKRWWRLWLAYQWAKKYYSKEFLKDLRGGEEAFKDKFLRALEETDRYASEEARKARERWDAGKFTRSDRIFLAHYYAIKNYKDWQNQLPHEKEIIQMYYRDQKYGKALAALQALYYAFAGAQDPKLEFIQRQYPEPTRFKDELLERLIKSRRLSPGSLAFLESHKSYRQPNPVRIMEKQLMDSVLIQMRKFTPRERVDILLDVVGIKPLSKEQRRDYNGRVLSRNRKKAARDYMAVRSLYELKNYMSLLHSQDRMLLVRSLFYAKSPEEGKSEQDKNLSLHDAPQEVVRLFRRLIVQNKSLPPFLKKVFFTYFHILNSDEKARLIAAMLAQENVAKELTGPEVLKVALKNSGVTGAKIAQALHTHKGLIPEEYARALGLFKENAQEMAKMRSFEVMRDAMAEFDVSEMESPSVKIPSIQELEPIAASAVPRVKGSARYRLIREVRYLLRDHNRRIRRISELGPELGAGSIKIVYKAVLEDGRIWVIKFRAPGAGYGVHREFEILDQLVSRLEAGGDIHTPGARQLLDEVKKLILAEMNLQDEARKESMVRRRVAERSWVARFLGAPRPFVPAPNPIYVSDDLLVEEFVPTIRFSDLPRTRIWGPSQEKIAKLAVAEGMFELLYDGWLEPDPHSGNRHAKAGLHRLWTKLVLMDLGQGEEAPVELLKPLMRAALALDVGDVPVAARALLTIIQVPEGTAPDKVLEVLEKSLAQASDTGLQARSLGVGQDASSRGKRAGVIERMMEALVEAEKLGALVRPEYASLQKAFIFYSGYSDWLSENYLFRSLERAWMARLWRDASENAIRRRSSSDAVSEGASISRWKLLKLKFREMLFGRAAVRAELERFIDDLGSLAQ